ncbi:MAG: hypothetical protein GYB21_00975 [Oceanospirillales bacterium]|nr:hypothetical protein [Oceanospirillales bacterium]
MLHLFTGLPGSTKTANMLHYVQTKLKQKGKGSWAGRPVYFYNINGCCADGWTELTEEECRKWYELPEGSIILIDEAQMLFRPVQKKDQVSPPEITELERHRHKGFDLLLTTQHPMLIHTAVRRQVQMHWHLERPYGLKTKAYKWEKCRSDPDDHFARKEAEVESVKVPNEIFTLYQSTVLDTHKKRIPKKLLIVLGSIVFVIVGMVAVIGSITARSTPEVEAAEHNGSSVADLIQPAKPSKDDDGSFKPVYPTDPNEYRKLFEPRLPHQPATAPVYDELMKPVVAPRTLCYGYRKQGVDHCECVTQQMTPVDMPFARCKYIVDKGMWDPTLKPASYNANGNLLEKGAGEARDG